MHIELALLREAFSITIDCFLELLDMVGAICMSVGLELAYSKDRVASAACSPLMSCDYVESCICRVVAYVYCARMVS